MRSKFNSWSPGRRALTLSALVVAGTALVAALWISWNLFTAMTLARSASAQASQAAQNGDTVALEVSVEELSNAARQVQSVAWSPPVTVASWVPYFGRSLQDFQHFSDAGVSAMQAAKIVAPEYKANIFANQTINLQTVDSILAVLPQASDQLDAATNSLLQVQANGIAGGTIAKYRDDALAAVATLDVAANQLAPNRAAVLDALGANGPKNYLIPLLNNAQLRASGGAPLSVAIIRVDRGKLSVPFNGYVNGKAFKGHPPIQYKSADPVACESKADCGEAPLWGSPSSGLSFVNSNANPDWRMSGQDLMLAWNTAKDDNVAGVMSLDTKAIESILGVVGPIQTSQYGEVSDENFQDLILENAYEEFADDQHERQDVNDEIGQAVIAKLLSGDAATLARTIDVLVQDAQGRHVQAYFANPTLEAAAQTLGLGGVVRTAQGSDGVSIYSRNRNMSKVDVYSHRSIDSQVVVAADGSATVTQTLKVKNEATERGDNPDRIGYLTGWSANDWFVVLPPGATNAQLQTPDGYTKVTTHPDGLGRDVLATTGKIAPGGTAELVASYTLPAGTFATADGGVKYQVFLNPQPIQNPTTATVDVQLPAGAGKCEASPQWDVNSQGATWSGELTTTEQLWISCPRN